MNVSLIDANDTVLCATSTDLAGKIQCEIVPSSENVVIKIDDKRFTKFTETIVVTKDEQFTKQLEPQLAVKLTAKIGEKAVTDLSLQLNNDPLMVRTTDVNGNAFYLLPDPVADSYELTVSDSNFKYYTQKTTLNVAPNKESHQFFQEIEMVERRQMIFTVGSKGLKLNQITVSVADQQGKQFLGGKTDTDGMVVFDVEESDPMWVKNQLYTVTVFDESNTYQPAQKTIMITGSKVYADFQLSDKVKVFVTLLDAKTQKPASEIYFIANYAGNVQTIMTDSEGKATLPVGHSYMELQKNFKVQIDGNHLLFKQQDCQEVTLSQTTTDYKCELVRWEKLVFEVTILDLQPCQNVDATLIAEHSIKMFSNKTDLDKCKVTFEALENSGQLKIGVHYTYVVQLKGYDTVKGSLVIQDKFTQAELRMVKSDNPNVARVFVMDSVFMRPIPGLIGEFNFSNGQSFWSFSNSQGLMDIVGTKAQPLENGMAMLLMNDSRVNSKGVEIFILVNQQTPQQINLPVVGGILISVTTEAKPTPSFFVAVTYNGSITTGKTLNGKYAFLIPNDHGSQRSFNITVSDPNGKYVTVSEESVTLDQNNKAERTYEMNLAYKLEARVVDVNQTGIPNIQVTVKRVTSFGSNSSIGMNMTDNNGIFKFVAAEQIFFTKDTLYFEFVDPANKYKNETVQVNVSSGQTEVRVDKQILQMYVIALINTYIESETRIGTQASFDFQINSKPQKRLITDQRGVALIHQQTYPELLIGAKLTLSMAGDKYLNDVNQNVDIVNYSQLISIPTTQRIDAPLTIDFELFDSINLLHLRKLDISLKQDGQDVQTTTSSVVGAGTFTLDKPYKATSKYEIYSNDPRFNLPPTEIKPNQAHFYTSFLIEPHVVVMVDYLFNKTVDTTIGVIGLNVSVTEGGKEIDKTLTDLNGKVAIYISKDDLARAGEYEFSVFDIANRYKAQTNTVQRKANEKSTQKEIYVEQADEITINYQVTDTIFNKTQALVQVTAKVESKKLNVRMYTDRHGVISLNTRDHVQKFAIGDKVEVNFLSSKMKSHDESITIDKIDVIGGLVKLEPFLALQFNAIDEKTKQLIKSNTLTFLVTKDNYNTVTMPLTHTKEGLIQYFAEESNIDSTKDCEYNVSVFDGDSLYENKKFQMIVKKGENKVIMDVKLTPIKPITVEYSVLLTDTVHKHQVYGVHTTLTVNGATYSATSDFSGVAKFVGAEVVEGRDATIEIKGDSMFKDFSQAVKIDSKTQLKLEIVPLFPVKFKFTDEKDLGVKSVQVYGQYGADQMIILGMSNVEGIVISYLPQEAISTKALNVTYKNVRYMEGSKTYDLAALQAIDETIKLDLAIYIQIHVADETASIELPNISVTAVCVSRNVSFFVGLLTNATGYVTHISKTPLFNEGDQIEVLARDMSGKYKGQVQKFTMAKDQQYINTSILMVQNYVFFVQVNDQNGKGLPAATIAVKKPSSTDPISLNTTDDNGYIMITSVFMSISDGDTLRFIVISENYTKAEQSVQFSLAVKSYNITIVSAIAKTISATFKIKNCEQDLKTTMIVLFSQHIQKGQMNMTECQAKFDFSESSNILGKNQEIQFNAFAYGYQHYAGTQTCTGENIIIEIQPVKTTEIKTMLIKVEDDVYTMPVMNNATLQLGPCQLSATSDLFGNLFFKSTDSCKMYKNGDAKLEIFDDLKTFQPLNKLIQINESQYYKVTPYLILKLQFEDKNDASIKGNDLLVTVGSEAHPVIHMGKTSAHGTYICRIPQSQIAQENSKYLVSYSDLELRFAQGEFDFVVPNGNKYELVHQLVRQFTFKILIQDGRGQGLQNINLTLKDNNQNEICKTETFAQGEALCVIDSSKLKLGDVFFITAVDQKQIWTTITTKEQVPLQKYQAQYVIKMFQPVSAYLEFLDQQKPTPNVAFQILKQNEIKITGKSDKDGKFTASWSDGSVSLYDVIKVEVIDSKYKRSSQEITFNTANIQQNINLLPIGDISVEVKITNLTNCSAGAQVVLFDSQKKAMFSDSTKTCQIVFKNSQSHQQGLLELNGKYTVHVSSTGYNVAQKEFVLAQDGQLVEVKMIKGNEGGLSNGALAGIILGAIVAVGALVALVYLCVKKPSAQIKRMNEELEMPLLNE